MADEELVAGLRRGDEAAFRAVVQAWSPAMRRVARTHVSTDATADEVVQDAWLDVVRGIDRFAGRSSLRSWVFAVLVNTAKSRGVSESRTAALVPAADPSRFRGPGDPWERHWTPEGTPLPWESDPAEDVLRTEVRDLVDRALAGLPERQRQVVVLRDVEGFSSDEVRLLLDLTPENQRVLLHRGRARVRAALEDHYGRTP